jgi:hypothetical protein
MMMMMMAPQVRVVTTPFPLVWAALARNTVAYVK